MLNKVFQAKRHEFYMNLIFNSNKSKSEITSTLTIPDNSRTTDFNEESQLNDTNKNEVFSSWESQPKANRNSKDSAIKQDDNPDAKEDKGNCKIKENEVTINDERIL